MLKAEQTKQKNKIFHQQDIPKQKLVFCVVILFSVCVFWPGDPAESQTTTTSDILPIPATTTTPSTNPSVAPSTAAAPATPSLPPHIQPRSSWITSSQEAYTKLHWKPKENVSKLISGYHDPKYFVIHHTEDIEGSNSIEKLRRIFQFHAVERKWGDIGYNYVIDKEGVIYEARKGGNGVRGAHSLNSITGRNYNYGSIGIAILGNYSNEELSPEAQDSLVKLVGWLAYANNIRLDETVKAFVPINRKRGSLQKGSRKVRTLLTHRDVDDTTCPGDNIYDRIGQIRLQAMAYQASYRQLAYKVGTQKAYIFKKGYRYLTKSKLTPVSIHERWFDIFKLRKK